MSRFRFKSEALVPKKKGPAPKLFQNERCRICSESAEGVNYNAISCMACKAFYRRVVVAGKELRLVFNQNVESEGSIDRLLFDSRMPALTFCGPSTFGNVNGSFD